MGKRAFGQSKGEKGEQEKNSVLWINQFHSHMGSPDALLKIATLFSMTGAQQTEEFMYK